MSGDLSTEPEDDDDEILWNCGCGLLVVDSLHCPSCGACAPWGCGGDHDDDEDDSADPFIGDPFDDSFLIEGPYGDAT